MPNFKGLWKAIDIIRMPIKSAITEGKIGSSGLPYWGGGGSGGNIGGGGSGSNGDNESSGRICGGGVGVNGSGGSSVGGRAAGAAEAAEATFIKITNRTK